jgi:hypothetical protein
MKNPNKTPTYKRPLKALTAASALAVVASGIGMSEASATSRPSQRPAISAEVPFKVLTGVVARLGKGGQTEVAAHNIQIPGPIGVAEGQPIVFKSDGRTYFAYTQEQGPNFNQKRPADVAGDMAIVREPVADARVPLEEAHLDKQGILVDENQIGVGYSTGGDTGK